MKAFDKALIETMRDDRYNNVYVNMARMRDGNWSVCWMSEYFGSANRQVAVSLRREWLRYLNKNGGTFWKAKDLKTIKII